MKIKMPRTRTTEKLKKWVGSGKVIKLKIPFVEVEMELEMNESKDDK